MKDRKLTLITVLIVLNLCFIWGNSMLPAEVSQNISDYVQKLLPEGTVPAASPEMASGIVRKIAHVAEFACLGFLLSWRAALLGKPIPKAVLWGVAAACLDESIQMVIPGRGPGVLDVVIDTFGLLTGMILLKTGNLLCRWFHTRKQGENKQ